MTLHARLALSASFVTLTVGCFGPSGPDPRSFDVADHEAALTDAGDDSLFTLVYTGDEAREEARLEVHVKLDDGTISLMPYTIDPQDGSVDADDTLLVREPGVDLFSGDHEGDAFSVEVVYADADDPTFVDALFEGTWTP